LGTLCEALLVYVFYLVFSWHQPTSALYRLGTSPVALFFRRALMPPLLYLRGIFWVLLTSKRPTFILGQTYSHGVWFYFPVVFGLKSPLAFLILLWLSPLIAIGRKWRRGESAPVISEEVAVHWRVVWVSLLVFTGVCVLSPLRSEEHTSELQSRENLVCRLLLEKKK